MCKYRNASGGKRQVTCAVGFFFFFLTRIQDFTRANHLHLLLYCVITHLHKIKEISIQMSLHPAAELVSERLAGEILPLLTLTGANSAKTSAHILYIIHVYRARVLLLDLTGPNKRCGSCVFL